NTQPTIDTKEPSTDPTIILGQSQTFNITKSDADNDTLNVAWYVDEIVQADYTSDTFKYTPTSVGSFAIKVKVSDGKASPVVETWALTVQSAQNQTTNQTASSGQAKSGQNISKSICGDGTCAEDEDYSTGTNPCCKDCGCGDDPAYKCAEDTGKCLKEVKSKNMIILIVVLGVFVVGAGVGLYLYKKKQEKSIFGLTDVHFEVPPKDAQAGAVKKEDPKKAEEKRPAQEPVKKKEEKPVDTAQKVKPADPQLKSYILYHLKKGKPFEDIKKELKQVGWKESQIEEAYTAAKLEETFS
ncbi:PKD domain-containing protein, partial [Candidatus Woesearchaeota archaeon]|nr:PKD domain-containing protein [Candidatus Woesearchaeota archaeon]